MNDLVFINKKKEAITTSRIIAVEFEKQHKMVLAKVEKLKKENKEIYTGLKIRLSSYTDDSGKKNKEYILNRDAYAFIAMGFTGNKAEQFKFDFIQAFNEMESWITDRLQNSLEYKIMSDTLHEVRLLAGKQTKHFHYANEAKLVNWAIFGKFKPLDRENLSQPELDLLYNLQKRNTVLIGAGMARPERKESLRVFAALQKAAMV